MKPLFLVMITIGVVTLVGCGPVAQVYSERVQLPEGLLQIRVFDNGIRLSTRHVRIEMQNVADQMLHVVYDATVYRRAGGRIELGLRLLQPPFEQPPPRGYSNGHYRVNLALPPYHPQDLFIDTGIHSEQPVSVSLY